MWYNIGCYILSFKDNKASKIQVNHISMENIPRTIISKFQEHRSELIVAALGIGLIPIALLSPIISNVEAQSPTEPSTPCTDQQKQYVNVVRDNVVNSGDLAAIVNESELNIGKLTLAATCFGQKVRSVCPEQYTPVFPACDKPEKCGPEVILPLYYIPGTKTGIAVSYLTFLGGKIEIGDLGISSLGGSCRVDPVVGKDGWVSEYYEIFTK